MDSTKRMKKEDKFLIHNMIWELRNIEYCLNFIIEYGKKD